MWGLFLDYCLQSTLVYSTLASDICYGGGQGHTGGSPVWCHPCCQVGSFVECAGAPCSAEFGGRVRAGSFNPGRFGPLQPAAGCGRVPCYAGPGCSECVCISPESADPGQGLPRRHDRRQWPVLAIQYMTWMQSELDDVHAAAKKRYKHSHPGACTYCGKYIKCDMYRYVGRDVSTG